jgi:hypothetical protein
MSVRLISHSKPVADSGIYGGLQDIVAFCTRVSNPANQNNMETNERLIRYLISFTRGNDSFKNVYERDIEILGALYYTDEDLKWDKPPQEVCLLIHLSVTLPLNLY